MCLIFGKLESDEDDSDEKYDDIPVIAISSSHDATPPKPKKTIGRRLFGGLMGNRGQNDPTRNPVARRINNDQVLGNLDWVINGNLVPARHSSFHEQYQFNRDAFSSTTRLPEQGYGDGDNHAAQTPLPSMGFTNSPWYDKWQQIEGEPYMQMQYDFGGGSVNGGDGVGSSSSHPI